MERDMTNHTTASPAGLPARIRRMADGGIDWQALEYPTRFAARKSTLYAMIQRGWTKEDAFRYLMLPGRPGYDLWGRDSRPVSHTDRVKQFHKDWNQATQFYEQQQARKRTRPDVMHICGELRALIAECPPQGRGWRNYRAVLLQSVTFAESSGSLTVKMPVRTVADNIGCSRITVSRYLDRADQDGWMHHIHRAYDYGEAHQYRVSETGPRKTVLQSGTDYESKSALALSDSPVSVTLCNTRAAGLYGTELGRVAGKSRIDTLVALAELCKCTGGPQSAAAVAKITGTDRSTTGRHLRKLAGLYPRGLVTDTGNGWIPRGDPEDYRLDPDPGFAAKQHRKHQGERAGFWAERAGYLDELRRPPAVELAETEAE